jgi:hypothetical protein
MLGALMALGSAPSASAGILPAGARVRIGSTFDAPAFESAVARRYHVSFHRILAADVDRDGDIDVIATTDRDLVVWVNDGAGHLTSQTVAAPPVLNSARHAATSDDGATHRDESIQDDVPSASISAERIHGPPDGIAAHLLAVPQFTLLARPFSSSAPRAPPV